MNIIRKRYLFDDVLRNKIYTINSLKNCKNTCYRKSDQIITHQFYFVPVAIF